MTLRKSLSLLVVLLITTAAPAQLFKRPQAGIPHEDDYPQLTGKGENAVIRYPVMHYHTGIGPTVGCAGYLYFSRDAVRYEVTAPANDRSHSFDHAKTEITAVGQWTQLLGNSVDAVEFRFSNGSVYHFARARKKWVEAGRSGTFEFLAYQELVDATRNFHDILDKVIAREARLHPAPPPANPPVISMLDPVGAEQGKVLELAATRVTLRGVASHASGISSVTVNNATALLKPLAPTTVEFQVPEFAVNAGTSAVIVMANATDKSTGQLIFTVNHPDVRVTEPAVNSETDKEAVKVRGVAVGFRSVDRVEIGGKPATLQTMPGGEVEFVAEAVPLTIGANVIQGYVTPRDAARMPFKIDVKRNPPPGPPPLTLNEVVEALQKGVPAARVTSLVSQFGVSFPLTDDAEKQLRSAGADTNLLLAIAKSKK